MPAGSLGYLNLLALIPLNMLIAPLGARTAHRIPKNALRYAFAAFLLATSVRMFVDLI